MRGLRLKFMLHFYNWSSRVYAELFKAHKEDQLQRAFAQKTNILILK